MVGRGETWGGAEKGQWAWVKRRGGDRQRGVLPPGVFRGCCEGRNFENPLLAKCPGLPKYPKTSTITQNHLKTPQNNHPKPPQNTEVNSRAF